MRIPVFVSCPTKLTATQKRSRRIIQVLLDDLQLEARALGRSDYPKDVPLKEVFTIARHCHGGVVLGFEQLRVVSGQWNVKEKKKPAPTRSTPLSLPTPWNQLEAGILFGLRLPLLIFREENVYGGIFDVGTTEVFVHPIPPPHPSQAKRNELKEVFLKWHGEVSRVYHSY
jgi:hypothetical protein